jgi:hypothetical protein
VSPNAFLDSAMKYLGPGYKEVSPGTFVSADGMRQVRFGAHETRGPNLHGHFEAYDKPGGRVVENSVVKIRWIVLWTITWFIVEYGLKAVTFQPARRDTLKGPCLLKDLFAE